MKYVIWSFRKQMWWNAERSGYTVNVDAAGKYDRDEAASIVFGGLPGANVAVDLTLAERFKNQEDAEKIEWEMAAWRRL